MKIAIALILISLTVSTTAIAKDLVHVGNYYGHLPIQIQEGTFLGGEAISVASTTIIELSQKKITSKQWVIKAHMALNKDSTKKAKTFCTKGHYSFSANINITSNIQHQPKEIIIYYKFNTICFNKLPAEIDSKYHFQHIY